MLLACTVFFAVFHRALDFTALVNPYWQTGLVCLALFLAAGLAVLVRRLAERKKQRGNRRGTLAAEGILVVLLLAAGILLRRGMLLRTIFIYAGPVENTYFELAKVDGGGIPLLSYGAQYIYVCMLRALFLVVGNHYYAGIVLQLVLQTSAALIWYLAVRRLSGRTAGLVVLTVLMLMPLSIREALLYSPRMLYFLLFGIGLLLAGGLFKQQSGTRKSWFFWFWTAVFAAAAAMLTYLDPAGLLMLIPVCYIAVVQGHKNLFRQWAVLLGVFLLVLAGCFVSDAWLSGAGLSEVVGTWLYACKPKTPVWSELAFLCDNTGMELFMQAGIAFLILLGLPAFFCRRRKEGQILWILLTMGLTAICMLRTDYVEERYELLLLAFFAALAGTALEALLAVEPEAVAAMGTAREKTEEKTEEKAEAETKIRLIENPLPLPKKHVKKTMGYQREVLPEEMHYDIEVPDTDDFDLADEKER